jgi:hypothetical protein
VVSNGIHQEEHVPLKVALIPSRKPSCHLHVPQAWSF